MRHLATNLNHAGIFVRFFMALVALHLDVRAADTNGFATEKPSQFRLAFSVGIIGEINRNDANASIMAWGKALLDQRHILADAQSIIFDRTEDLFRALQSGEVDGAAILTDEFFTRPITLAPETVYLSLKNGKTTEQYVLLVHRVGGISDLVGLKGRNLALELHKSARTSLAEPWLDTCLAGQELGLSETIFRKIERPEKVSRAVLRVFFRQADACLVTKAAFETMCELNPQLRKELRVLATSPEVVPSLFFLRPGFKGRLREEVDVSIATMHETVPGRQALTIFQGEKLGKYPLSCLDEARKLLAQHKWLKDTAAGSAPVQGKAEESK